MKTEIVLVKNTQSARITLTYSNPFTSTSVKVEGDPNIIGIFNFYSEGSHGYFMGSDSPLNAERYLNVLPMLRLNHKITSTIDNIPPFEKYMEPAEDNVVY